MSGFTAAALPPSKLVRHQVKEFGPKPIAGWGKRALIKAKVRYDDECGNGHNSFAITGEIYIPGRSDVECCGMIHEEIAKHFPELLPFLKWHLTSSDGPMHYIANTTYWAKQGNLEYARSSAVWPDATLEQLQDEQALRHRMPDLMAEFEAAVKSLGFEY